MRRRLRATAAGLALTSVVAMGIGADRVEATDAAWANGQHAAAGTISGAQLTAPTITSCRTSGVTFSGVTITWTSMAPIDTTTQAVYFGTTLGTVTPTRTGTVSGVHTYSVTYPSGLLNTLLGSLLGSSTQISVRTRSGSNWMSAPATATLTVGLAGLGHGCSVP